MHWAVICCLIIIHLAESQFYRNYDLPRHTECKITDPFASEYISAYQEPRYDCEIHLLILREASLPQKIDSEKPVQIKVVGKFNGSVVIVLASLQRQPIVWKLETQGLDNLTKQPTIVIDKESTISPSNNIGLVQKRRLPTSLKKLSEWTERKYSTLTTMIVNRQNSQCNEIIIGSEPSECKKKSKVSKKHQVPMIGCLSPQTVPEPACVVEWVDSGKSRRPTEVHLEISPENNQKMDGKFHLVIKTPAHVRWKVQTKKLQGTIDIVSNGHDAVEQTSINMDTVAMRFDQLDHSGKELIEWTSSYVGPVKLYVGVKKCNKIKLKLPTIGPSIVTKLVPSAPPVLSPSPTFISPSHIRVILTEVMHVECEPMSLTIALEKSIIQTFNLKTEQITLLDTEDSNCAAEENSTHITLHTLEGLCDTKTSTLNGQIFLVNAMVIHSLNRPEVASDNDMGSGHQMTDVIGSAPTDTMGDVYIDDEDIEDKSIKIAVKCEVLNTLGGRIKTTPSQFRVRLFADEKYSVPIFATPYKLTIGKTYYVQASFSGDDSLGGQIQRCLISPTQAGLQVKVLVDHGCKRDSSVKFPVDEDQKKADRFSFELKDYYANFGVHEARLICHVYACTIKEKNKHQRFETCDITQKERCVFYKTSWPHKEPANSHEFILGPIHIGKEENIMTEKVHQVEVVKEDTTVTEKEEKEKEKSVVVEGLDSEMVVVIAFAAFVIGILLTAALWFIHTHTGRPRPQAGSSSSSETSGDSTPSSTAPIST